MDECMIIMCGVIEIEGTQEGTEKKRKIELAFSTYISLSSHVCVLEIWVEITF